MVGETTYRSRGRLVGGLSVIVLVLVALAAMVAQPGWAVPGLVGLLLVVGWAAFLVLVAPSVRVGTDDVVIVNVLRTIQVPFRAVRGVETGVALVVRTEDAAYPARALPGIEAPAQGYPIAAGTQQLGNGAMGAVGAVGANRSIATGTPTLVAREVAPGTLQATVAATLSERVGLAAGADRGAAVGSRLHSWELAVLGVLVVGTIVAYSV